MFEIADIPDAANFEIIALSPQQQTGYHELVYEELKPTFGYDTFKDDLNYLQNGHSPDHGYESDLSSSSSQYSLTMNAHSPIAFSEAVSPCSINTVADSPVDNSALESLFPLKLEEIDEILPCTWKTFTDALNFNDATLEPSWADPRSSYPEETYSNKSTSECDVTTSVCPSRDSGIYSESCHESSAEELEISESEDVECHVTCSPMPHDAASNKKKQQRRRKRSSKQPILWKFLLDALNEPEKYGTMIHWVDKSEGTFQFNTHHKEKLSQQWGEAKRNRCKMTYQKMARALRNYINRQEVLQKVKKKLQYTFIPEFYTEIQHMVK